MLGVTDVLEKDDVNLMLAIKTQGEVGGPGWQHLRTEKVEAQDLIIKQKTEENAGFSVLEGLAYWGWSMR